MEESMSEYFGEPVYQYTRAQAIEDGELVDVSELAREAGVRFPVAVTRALWEKHIVPPVKLAGCQDATGRLWDVLWLFRLAAQRGGREIRFTVLFAERSGRPPVRREVRALCGPGDDARPVVTLMLPDED
jgi:hypothetical protein